MRAGAGSRSRRRRDNRRRRRRDCEEPIPCLDGTEGPARLPLRGREEARRVILIVFIEKRRAPSFQILSNDSLQVYVCKEVSQGRRVSASQCVIVTKGDRTDRGEKGDGDHFGAEEKRLHKNALHRCPVESPWIDFKHHVSC